MSRTGYQGPPVGDPYGYSSNGWSGKKAPENNVSDPLGGSPEKGSPFYAEWREMTIQNNPPGTYLRTILETEIEKEKQT